MQINTNNYTYLNFLNTINIFIKYVIRIQPMNKFIEIKHTFYNIYHPKINSFPQKDMCMKIWNN